ncbi:ATP-binding protein (plasmid) [Neorhizobium sp. DAR64861/K0K2]|uniref:ATP-binding protein n=1 Tax=Neorhizobium sp. DAR64861/K0K2 TaxID=3421956 RepID=UPI003D2A93DD
MENAGTEINVTNNNPDDLADVVSAPTERGVFTPKWASDAPRGGRTVLTRALKESAAVPLFLAQTFIQSLRDVGYDSTTSALCEHVDNSIEAGATEIRIFIRQTGRKDSLQTDVLVWDNGRGMPPNVLQVAMAFGGSMSFGNRSGIGRFGMGMKTAGLSMSPIVEVYSWQEPGAFYRMILDSNAIGRDKANLIALPEPEFTADMGADVTDFFTKALRFPKNASDQKLLADKGTDLVGTLGRSGTIVYMPECDRLSYVTDRNLVEHATKEMAHVYRRHLAKGLKLYINNRRVIQVDPTFSMPNARHAEMEGLKIKTSRLVVPRKVTIRQSDSNSVSYDISVKLYALPIEEWALHSRKLLKDIGVFSGHNISILRNDREVFAGYISQIAKKHSEMNWFRIEIDFPGELDEAFGVASNKQGVRLKDYVINAINDAIGDDITAIRAEIHRFQAQRNVRDSSAISPAEAKANETDPFQSEVLETELSDEEKKQMDANLWGLAIGLKRDNETDEQAFERVKGSKYIITYRHDEYWPFYHVENKFGRIILTINTAHPFYAELYEPLLKTSSTSRIEDDDDTDHSKSATPTGPVIALELMLLSLARSQSVMTRENPAATTIFDGFRRKWSETLRVQLTA